MQNKSDKILVKKCLKGNSRAQKELYERFSTDMFRVCLSYAANYDSANDLLQEGFLKVFKNLHKYKYTGSLGGWIRQVIINNCIDLYRKNTHRDQEVSIEDEQFLESKIISINNIEKHFDNADFLMIIKDLPVGYRIVLNLYYLEDYKHREIAEKLDITVGTSKSQLSKAKKYLKRILVNTLSEEELSKYERLDKRVV